MNFPDISRYQNVGDWTFILLGILITDLIVLFLTRFYPAFMGKAINKWYDEFKLSAVISDVFVIALGFALARYVYSWTEMKPFHLGLFLLILVGIQALHDILFYVSVILPIPIGHNRMIDVFKEYGNENSWKILLADAAMMVSSAFLAMWLKSLPADQTAFIGLFAIYTLPYILETSV
jgi:hypothetical protein